MVVGPWPSCWSLAWSPASDRSQGVSNRLAAEGSHGCTDFSVHHNNNNNMKVACSDFATDITCTLVFLDSFRNIKKKPLLHLPQSSLHYSVQEGELHPYCRGKEEIPYSLLPYR